jgi:hypothetical protein
MQLPAQFVEADVMSVGKLDYVAGLGTLFDRLSFVFIQICGDRLRNSTTSTAERQAEQIGIDFSIN